MLRVRRLAHLSPKSFKAHILRRWASSAPSKSPQKTPESVQFQSNLAARSFILDSYSQSTNVYDIPAINAIRSKVQAWDIADLCSVIIGINQNKCSALAGGDVTLVTKMLEGSKREKAITCFKKDLELSHRLAGLNKPYVAVMNGHAMGGIAGLALHAPFRVATENTVFSMPQTALGYISGGGVNYTLSRLDGQLGTYLSLTGLELKGRAVFEHGIATHYIPERRIPELVERLSSVEEVSMDKVDEAIEELFFERSDVEDSSSRLFGMERLAIDRVFSGATLPDIMDSLAELSAQEGVLGQWARLHYQHLQQRSPDALRVALEAIRRSEEMSLEDVLQMEMRLATTYANIARKNFSAPITDDQVSDLVRKQWTTEAGADQAKREEIQTQAMRKYFDGETRVPELAFAGQGGEHRAWLNYGLPSEEEIRGLVTGTHLLTEGPVTDAGSVVLHFHQLRGAKHGMQEKVGEVLERCSVESSEGELEWVYN